MLRWILGGRGSQGVVEKSAALCIGEEQPKNCFTELQVLKGHFDIVRFLVQIDDFRFASAGDDGMVLVWNVQTGERLVELRGHTQQITAMISYTFSKGGKVHTALLTASSDRTLSCLMVLNSIDLWLSGGNELCVWNRSFQLQCKTVHHRDTGITAMVELPKNCIAAAMDKEIVIFKLNLSDPEMTVLAIRHLADHQDTIRTLISINGDLFASGSHNGELILWDTLDWTIQAYELILWEEPGDGQSEIRMGQQKQTEMSIHHLTTDGELVVAAIGSGLYVYNALMKMVVAYRKIAHDSDVLHTMLLDNRQVMSCSEDGSVRIWELQELPLAAEPASSGFFGMFGTFGRSGKQAAGAPVKKLLEVPGLRSLELIGDLIGHSGAVQMFLSFGEKGLVTCSADHLLIVWKDGERESQLRSLALFEKLEEMQGL